jgi:hypothetical protein
MHECKSPHLQSDDVWQSFHCVEEHCTGSCCDDTNVVFNHSILPMRAYSTERLVLVGSVDVLVLKNLGCKDTIVTVDVLD